MALRSEFVSHIFFILCSLIGININAELHIQFWDSPFAIEYP